MRRRRPGPAPHIPRWDDPDLPGPALRVISCEVIPGGGRVFRETTRVMSPEETVASACRGMEAGGVPNWRVDPTYNLRRRVITGGVRD